MYIRNPDLVLLHAPAVYDFRERPLMFGPIADGVPSSPLFEMYPIGFFSILEHLERGGMKVRIVNLAARMLGDASFDPEKMIRKLKPAAFGIDLHWLAHAHGSLEVAKVCKKYHPETPVIFGGLSATYFHDELIRYPAVDFVIRGDSTEEPFLRLMKVITARSSEHLDEIPNLVWKDEDSEVRINPFTHVPSRFNGCANNYIYAFRTALRYMDIRSLSPWKSGSSHWMDYPITPIITCRGCMHNCTFCGGSKKAVAHYCNRNKASFRDPEMIAEEILKITAYTRAPIFIIGDLLQSGKEYAYKVLEGLREKEFENHLVFELFTCAPEEYFKLVGESVKNFNFEISPDTHDEKIRSREGKHYTNAQIEANIEWAMEHGCNRFDLFFMIGLPLQDCESVMDTVEWCGELMGRFGKRVVPFILSYSPFLDPGSIAYENASEYGYRIRFRTLEEYRKAMLSPSWKYALNYETEWMSRDEIVDCTYRAGMHLNRLKAEYGVIDQEIFRSTEERIKLAIELTHRIDEIMKLDDQKERQKELNALKPELDMMLDYVINEKVHMEWPASKKNLKLFNLAKAAISELFRW
ncbi:TIGR04190 family B12-binding domain/radical SAM domain protein [Methanosarcinales archaeon]|nr:MAG: TIGR04190 family B12-binding domain/radical SAM domain protein [Methanosarcinales archaeon]